MLMPSDDRIISAAMMMMVIMSTILNIGNKVAMRASGPGACPASGTGKLASFCSMDVFTRVQIKFAMSKAKTTSMMTPSTFSASVFDVDCRIAAMSHTIPMIRTATMIRRKRIRLSAIGR